jgi:hypothetical protein
MQHNDKLRGATQVERWDEVGRPGTGQQQLKEEHDKIQIQLP